jgi:hypothetical protein
MILRWLWVAELITLVSAIAVFIVGIHIGGFNGAYLAAMILLAVFAWLTEVRRREESR